VRACVRARLCVYSFNCPACKTHAPYYIIICGLPDCTTFFHFISQKARIFENFSEYKMCRLILSPTLPEISLFFENNSSRCFHKCEDDFVLSTRYSCQILMRLELSGQSFEKKLKYEMLSKFVQWKTNFTVNEVHFVGLLVKWHLGVWSRLSWTYERIFNFLFLFVFFCSVASKVVCFV
jgi:hypothetical protein